MGDRAGLTDADRAGVALARCAALEKLLACYRTGRQPSESLHRELARTKAALTTAFDGFTPVSNGPERDDET